MVDSYQYVTSTGVIVPDTSQILSGVQTEYKGVLGADLNVSPSTPQGGLIAADTLSRVQEVNNNAVVANSINPNLAGGVALDAIMALTFPLGRARATSTIVPNVTLTGVAGTVISAGTQAKTAAGDVFATQSLVTLDGTGNATVSFASVVTGAIPCAVNALNTIVTNILGWETVNNTTAGILGSATQSDQATKALRSNTLGFQGVALPVAATSALYATSGVTSLKYVENEESIPAGMLISVTNGSTLSDTIWGMTTTGNIVVGVNDINFAESQQDLPVFNPWPVAKYTTTGNITLSALTTQGGGDWPSTMTAGDIVLAKDQTTASQNGVYVVASGAWARQAYNTNGTTIQGSLSGISLKGSSIYTCVNGGSDLDVAAALLENKSSGCGWNGNITVNLIEPASRKSYPVQFDRPEVIPVVIRVTTSNGNSANIIQTVEDYTQGLIEGLAGYVVGSDVSPFEISGAIMSRYPGYFISKVEVSLASSISYTTNTLPIATNEIASTPNSYITVIIA